MNIEAFNRVVAPAVQGIMSDIVVEFSQDGDGLKAIAGILVREITGPKEKKVRLISNQVTVSFTLSDIEIYSVKYQSLIAFICDKIWNALLTFEPTTQEKE